MSEIKQNKNVSSNELRELRGILNADEQVDFDDEDQVKEKIKALKVEKEYWRKKSVEDEGRQ